MKIDSIRDEYTYSGLERRDLANDPVSQFQKWMEEAIAAGVKLPTAMTVTTFGTDGFPHARIVLLKYFDQEGFVYFTNYESEKGRALGKNNATGLHFFWPELERQVKILGYAGKTNRTVSEKYFMTRPAESRISAWASPQSREVPSRRYLEEQYNEYLKKFGENNIPLPSFWGGYQVVPQKVEFWQGRMNRLHDRFLYEKNETGWEIKRLGP